MQSFEFDSCCCCCWPICVLTEFQRTSILRKAARISWVVFTDSQDLIDYKSLRLCSLFEFESCCCCCWPMLLTKMHQAHWILKNVNSKKTIWNLIWNWAMNDPNNHIFKWKFVNPYLSILSMSIRRKWKLNSDKPLQMFWMFICPFFQCQGN